MLANSSSQNDHSGFLRFSRELVQVSDVLYNIHDEARIAERVEVDHISEGAVGECGTEDRNVVLHGASSARVPGGHAEDIYSLCTPSNIQIPHCLSPCLASE